MTEEGFNVLDSFTVRCKGEEATDYRHRTHFHSLVYMFTSVGLWAS